MLSVTWVSKPGSCVPTRIKRSNSKIVFGSIADRLVLVPSVDPIDLAGQHRHVIKGELGELEVLERVIPPTADPAVGVSDSEPAKILVLKFPGAGGRAERSSPHPTEAWPDLASVIWTVNPPGYGSSQGKASIRNLGPTADAVIEAAFELYADHAFILCGNSLGNLPALYLAASYPDRVAGILMRNPPPLREVIQQRHPWWKTFGIASVIGSSIPDQLDCIANAKHCRARAVMVTCEADRVVPANLQNQVFEEMSGEKRQLIAKGADHADPIPEEQLPAYADLLKWLVEPLRG